MFTNDLHGQDGDVVAVITTAAENDDNATFQGNLSNSRYSVRMQMEGLTENRPTGRQNYNVDVIMLVV